MPPDMVDGSNQVIIEGLNQTEAETSSLQAVRNFIALSEIEYNGGSQDKYNWSC